MRVSSRFKSKVIGGSSLELNPIQVQTKSRLVSSTTRSEELKGLLEMEPAAQIQAPDAPAQV